MQIDSGLLSFTELCSKYDLPRSTFFFYSLFLELVVFLCRAHCLLLPLKSYVLQKI